MNRAKLTPIGTAHKIGNPMRRDTRVTQKDGKHSEGNSQKISCKSENGFPGPPKNPPHVPAKRPNAETATLAIPATTINKILMPEFLRSTMTSLTLAMESNLSTPP
jgi:hypothetical protein